MATKSAFHPVGRLYESDGEYKFVHFGLGTFYTKGEMPNGGYSLESETGRVGYFRKPNKETKVYGYITWCDGDRTYQVFRNDDGELNVTFAYEYETNEPQVKADSGGGKAKSDRW